jgi:hypothetical protein
LWNGNHFWLKRIRVTERRETHHIYWAVRKISHKKKLLIGLVNWKEMFSLELWHKLSNFASNDISTIFPVKKGYFQLIVLYVVLGPRIEIVTAMRERKEKDRETMIVLVTGIVKTDTGDCLFLLCFTSFFIPFTLPSHFYLVILTKFLVLRR